MKRFFWLLTILITSSLRTPVVGPLAAEPVDVGSKKQLFVDELLIESSCGATLTMNSPYRDGKVLLTKTPDNFHTIRRG